MADNNQVLQALGYPTALPQSVVPVTKTSTQVQKTSYAPDKLEALMTALQAPRLKKSRMETLAGALAGVQDAPSFKGAYGVDVINPLAVGLSSLAQGFGGAYGDRLASAREAAMQEREDAIKAAQLEAEATKQAISDQIGLDYMKVNDPKAKSADQQAQDIQQRQAALNALKDLEELSQGGIGGWNNESDSRWNSKATAEILGRREQALSALLPLTNAIARASGGSGINTLGEMLAYLGVPENATSAQIKGVLPGLINKLGFKPEDVYPEATEDNVVNVNGYKVKLKR